MRISVERLRIGLLAGAGLLVLVIAGFLGYARYRVRRALVSLPGRMGATITKEFNGYTYSQSDGKRTVFTLHAAKAVQHKDNTLTLHDVQMVLYGKKGDRADRISGDEFEYDTKNEVVRAAGVVHIDLEAPRAEGGGGARADAGGRVVHVTTSGLVYMKQLAIAATDQGIDFGFGGFTGHAVGAEYSSDTGHLILQSAVTVSGLDKGRPVAMAATHGELDRANEVAEFENARYSSSGEVAKAELARIHMRGDGSVERIEGERSVSLADAAAGRVTSDRAEVRLDAKSRPVSAVLTGSVKFADDEPLRQVRGDSDAANLEFDGQGRVDHAVLTGRVHTAERAPGAGKSGGGWPQRDLAAARLDLVLAAAGVAGKAQLREATAVGTADSPARMVSVAPDAKTGGVAISKLAGETLVAHFVVRNGVAELSTVHGAGHTVVEQTTALGVDQRSAGEALDAEFRESGKGGGAVELAEAVQRGGVVGPVVIDRSVPAKKGSAAGTGPDLQHATAGRAAFDADTGRVTLTESATLSDAGSTVSAARVVMEEGSGDAAADGGVKVSYLQPTGTGEPVHVLAARAELKHDDGVATFYGGAAGGVPGFARMWQAGAGGEGGSQIEAPVLVFEQEANRLTARAEAPGVAGTVHTTLMDARAFAGPARSPGSSTAGGAALRVSGKAAAKPQRQGVARITSSMMVYSDVQRQAVFTGGVRVLDGDGEVRSREATVFMSPVNGGGAGKAGKAAATSATGLSGLTGGSVERIVASGQVAVTEPGRQATGERLVYTAADGMFVLTGTATAPPKVVDEARGTTTGAELRFHSGDDNVVVSGGNGDAVARRVRTETRVKEH
jgi:lipopolysaccharide export system protein LptA